MVTDGLRVPVALAEHFLHGSVGLGLAALVDGAH